MTPTSIVPRTVLSYLQLLRNNNFESFLVGGCVRDSLLKQEPKDWDIVTDARPGDLQKIFPNANLVGKSFGVVNVPSEEFPAGIEIATYRKDGTYSDGRRPDSVEYTGSFQEDAKRRDFTMNAIYWNPLSEIVCDPFRGIKGLEQGVIECVGSAEERLKEDRLRVLRAIRFAARFRFTLSYDLYYEIEEWKSLPGVSEERIQSELVKILSCEARSYGLELLKRTKVLKTVLPDVYNCTGIEQPMRWHPEGDVFHHTKLVLANIPEHQHPDLYLAAVLHDVGKPLTRKNEGFGRTTFHGHDAVGADLARVALEKLKFSNETIEKVVWLVENHMVIHKLLELRSSKRRRLMSHQWFPDLMLLNRADELGSLRPPKVYNWIQSQPPEEQKPVLPKPLVTGRDLIDLGFTPGPGFKTALNAAMDLQLEDPTLSKEDLVAVAISTYM